VEYVRSDWSMDSPIIISIGLGIGVPLVGYFIGYGMLKARSNGYGTELKRLNECKAEKDVVAAEFRSVNDKLDLILDMMREDK